MKFKAIVFAVFLSLFVSGGVFADTPTSPIYNKAQEHPEFYQFNANESLNTFGGSLRMHYVDMSLPGNGSPDITFNRVFKLQAFDKQNEKHNHSKAVYEWQMHFGRIYQINKQLPTASIYGSYIYESAQGYAQPLYWEKEGSTLKTADFSKIVFNASEKKFVMTTSNGNIIRFSLKSNKPEYYEPDEIEDVHGNKIKFIYKDIQLEGYSVTKLDKVVGYYPGDKADGRTLSFVYKTIENRAYLAAVGHQGSVIAYGYKETASGQMPLEYGAPTAHGAYMLSAARVQDDTFYKYAYERHQTGDKEIDFTDGYSAPAIKYMEIPTGGHARYTYKPSVNKPSNEHFLSLYSRTAYDIASNAINSHVLKPVYQNDASFKVISKDEIIYYNYNINPIKDKLYLYGTLKSKIYTATDGSENRLRTELYKWDGLDVSDVPSEVNNIKDSKTRRPILTEKKVIMGTQVGTTTFTKHDQYGYPQIVTEQGARSRTHGFNYQHNEDKSIIGLLSHEYLDGKLIGETVYNDKGQPRIVSDHGVITKYSYYHSGRLGSETDANGNTTYYAEYYRGIPRKTTLANGGEIYKTVDTFGNVTSETDALNHTRQFTYDPRHRIKLIKEPIGLDKKYYYNNLSSDNVLIQSGNSIEVRKQDGFGAIRNIKRTDYYTNITTQERIKYNSKGQEIEHGFPTQSRQDQDRVSTRYDGLGRVILSAVNTSEGSKSRDTHYSNIIDSTDYLGNHTYTSYEYYGDPQDYNITRIDQPEGMQTKLRWNTDGKLESITQGGLTRHFTYDQHLCLQSETHPEVGTYQYRRDALCHVLEKKLNGQLIASYKYNKLNQLSEVNFSDGRQKIITHDAKGNITEKSIGEHHWHYTYNELDQVTETRYSHPIHGDYKFTYEYNDGHQLSALIYPSGQRIDYAPNGFHQPTTVGSWATDIVYSDSGQLESFKNAAGITTSIAHDAFNRPTHLTSGNIIDLNYHFDAENNLTNLTDNINSKQSLTLGYDRLNRLAQADGPWGAGSISYDHNNNLSELHLGQQQINYNYRNDSRLAGTTGSINYNISYDPAGNISQRHANDAIKTYGINNELQQITGKDINHAYEYDANDNRVISNRNGEITLTLFDDNNHLLLEKNISKNETHENIYLDDTLIAESSNTDSRLYYSDIQGNAIAATKTDGTLIWRKAYTPFGGEILKQDNKNNSVGFSSKQFDKQAELSYFGARYYDPTLGRFLSLDPAAVDATNPFSFNRYIYANNNPYKYKDPDGRVPVLALVWAGASIAATGYDAYTSYQSGGWSAVGKSIARDIGISAAFGGAGKLVSKGYSALKGLRAAEKVVDTSAHSAKQAANLSEHLTQSAKYGKDGVKELESGRMRYYGDLKQAKTEGEMAGRRMVREWDPATGNKRTWHETLDHSGNVRQVRPQVNSDGKTHFTFDRSGRYSGSW